MKKNLFPVMLIVLAAMLGAAVYWQWKEGQSSLDELPPIVEEAVAPSEPTGPRYPIPSVSPDSSDTDIQSPDDELVQDPVAPDELTEPSEPMPTLNESSAVVTDKLSGLFGENWVPELFRLDEVIRRFVVTIDNLTNNKLPQQHLLVKPVTGKFLVAGEEDDRVISPDNAARYTPYVQLATHVDTQQLVAMYVQFYPLFQEAYAEIGNPDAYFNDRLVEVIDHLLMTPSVDEPMHLVQPKVFFEYADPDLEALSAGQKVLLRMGNANAEQIKVKLREVRQALTQEQR